MYLKFLILLIFSFSIITAENQQEERNGDNKPIYLGVLETKNSSWVTTNYNPYIDSTSIKIVRVLFYKESDEWKSFENEIENTKIYPSKVSWFIAFDGKQIGEFNSISTPIKYKSYTWTYPRDAYHKPEINDLPTIGKPDNTFSGWQGDIQPRPLVTVSKPFCHDAEQWKPFTPNKEIVKSITPKYKEYLINGKFLDSLKTEQVVLLKCYNSTNAGKLIQFGAKKHFDEEEYIDNRVWFYISVSGEIINLTDMIDKDYRNDDFEDDDFSTTVLVDAGDYDNDGKSEVLFWVERYNRDGYFLFYNNFKNMIDFTWSYH